MQGELMKLIFRSLAIIVLALLFVAGAIYWKVYYKERVIKSEMESQAKDSIFIHASKQFAFKIPDKYSVSEPTNGKQTIVYPSDKKISGSDVKSLIDQDVIIIETATNRKDSLGALINEIETQTKKAGSTVKSEEVDYGKLKGSVLTVEGKTNYKQILLNTPTLLILTCRIDHPEIESLAKSTTIDLSGYAEQISKATSLTRDTKQNIADGQLGKIYQSSSENLKKKKTEEEFTNLLKDIAPEFSNNVLIWGIYFNSKGIGTTVNVINQDKIIRRGSFFYIREKDNYLLDGLRLSGKIDKKVTDTETTKKK